MTDTRIIDAHMHIGPSVYPSVEERIRLMDAAGVHEAILVAHRQANDDDALADAVSRYPDRFVALGRLDEGAPDVAELVRLTMSRSGFRGLRVPAGARSPGRDRWAIWQALDEAAAVVSVRGTLDDLIDPELAAIVDRHQRITFRFEHLASVRPAEEPPPYPRYRSFLDLASAPNTLVQWSGCYLNSADGYPYPSMRPLLDQAIEAFGASRMVWSGDSDRAGISVEVYRREWELVHEVLPPAQAAAVLGETAVQLLGGARNPGSSRASRSSS